MKRIVFILAILLPIGVALFLKFFGKNQYKLPVYFKDNHPKVAGCAMNGPALFFNYFHDPEPEKVKVVFWFPECDDNLGFYKDQLLRVKSDLDSENYLEYFEVKNDSTSEASVSQVDKNEIALCGFFINEQNDEKLSNWKCSGFVVLLDWKNQIRGYYSGDDFEDIDRLILEIHVIKTMLKNE